MAASGRGSQGLPWLRSGAYWAAWAVLGLLFAAPILLQPALGGGEVAWSYALSELLRWPLWGLLTPLLWLLARRAPLARQTVWPNLAINLLGIGATTLLYAVLEMLKRHLIVTGFLVARGGTARDVTFADWQRMIYWGIEYHALTCLSIAAVIHAFRYYDELRERELKGSRLEAQLVSARLDMLKMQLHPHFLFNTLNAVSALMHRDVEAADKMIAELSSFLRLSLETDDRHLVPLRHELDFLERYLAIEKIRFRDRLQVNIDIPRDCLDAMVPRLVLQPLAENAFKHGFASMSAAGRLEIAARRHFDRLELRLADDGPGLGPRRSTPEREGVGLGNTRARLEQLYGDDARLELRDAALGGLEVYIELPFETTSRAPADAAVAPLRPGERTADPATRAAGRAAR